MAKKRTADEPVTVHTNQPHWRESETMGDLVVAVQSLQKFKRDGGFKADGFTSFCAWSVSKFGEQLGRKIDECL